MMDERDRAITAIAVVLAVAMIGFAVLAAQWSAEQCREAGGRIISKTSTGFGPALNGTGSMVMTTHNVDLCVTEDGRVLF